MICHLNAEQISAIAAGAASPEAAAHVESCALCQEQVERFESALGDFRGTVHAWSEVEFKSRAVVQPRMRLWPRIAYACAAAVMILVSVVGYRLTMRHSIQHESSAAVSDTALLERVKTDVSRSTPPGMDTLLGFTTTNTAQR